MCAKVDIVKTPNYKGRLRFVCVKISLVCVKISFSSVNTDTPTSILLMYVHEETFLNYYKETNKTA